jgi:hypothetical protein
MNEIQLEEISSFPTDLQLIICVYAIYDPRQIERAKHYYDFGYKSGPPLNWWSM